ncbi:RNA 3'-terminal phosphate cyclase [Portunus trituberculatus]|uniref:RNA 3'-terminal phosphate cyclase n=1 Tax=Portunus trituberculatus TaxID=210409 RepID=A0A5B7E373_PORTR|nr:RNA 3'-terminal phosphate cyclase [Portunus trituberculatus]
MASLAPIVIDGSYLEGGGQILRMGLALSAVQALPISVTKVRAGRSTPGLRPQHLTGLQLVRDASKGRLEGGQIGSCEITFYPGTIAGGRYLADTQTAGSVTLLIQAVLPCTLFANSPSYYTLRGGTNAEFAPQIDYTIQVAHKMANAAVELLQQRLPQNIDIRINRVKDDQERAFGNGSGIVLWAKTTTGCILGGSALGKRGREAEEDGYTAASEIISCVESRVCLDSYAQDQIIVQSCGSNTTSIPQGHVWLQDVKFSTNFLLSHFSS